MYLIKQGVECQIPRQERYGRAYFDSKTEKVIQYNEFN